MCFRLELGQHKTRMRYQVRELRHLFSSNPSGGVLLMTIGNTSPRLRSWLTKLCSSPAIAPGRDRNQLRTLRIWLSWAVGFDFTVENAVTKSSTGALTTRPHRSRVYSQYCCNRGTVSMRRMPRPVFRSSAMLPQPPCPEGSCMVLSSQSSIAFSFSSIWCWSSKSALALNFEKRRSRKKSSDDAIHRVNSG